MPDITIALERLLTLPRDQQVPAASKLLDALEPVHEEPWNSTFGPESLFDAWSRTSIAQGVHAALADRIRPVVARPGFVAVEVGAGNGNTWSSCWTGAERGTLIAIDPIPEAIDCLARDLPPGVQLVRHTKRVEDAPIPEADLIVCSMTLHHVAGRDADERRQYGLEGPGKLEVLERFGAALLPRHGEALLVEADVDCELDLPPGDPQLRDNIFDSYVRRCACSILQDLRDSSPPEPLAAAWRSLLQHWFLEQLRVADLPRQDRDVYELTRARWEALLHRAGMELLEVTPVDAWSLFVLYRFRPRAR